jgi:integrase/recombinase XerD
MNDLTPLSGQSLVPSVTLFDSDLSQLLASQLAASSIAMYRRDVKAYQAYALRIQGDAFNVHTFVDWRDSLVLSTTLSPNTINRMLSAVKRVLKEAAAKGQIDETVFLRFDQVSGVKVKALKKRLKQHGRTRISKEDMRLLCDAPNSKTLIGKRDRALLATLASSAGRVSEIATLTYEQIIKQDDGYVIQICGKTDTEYRDAHLSREAYVLILEWLAARQAFVDAHGLENSSFVFSSFGGRGNSRHLAGGITEAGVWQVVQKYAKQCGMAYIKPHDFRRFVGTQLAKKDIRKAQLALGHKSIEVTAKAYVLDKLEAGETDGMY